MAKVTTRYTVPFLVAALAIVSVVASGPVFAHDDTDESATSGMMMGNQKIPEMNADRGRILFVEKGCVACHAINGVGGHDATALDAHTMQPMMNPFDFAAKMWTMAPAMIAAQEEALGEQILFSGDELADIIAFVHDDDAQHHFSDADLTPQAREMMHHEHMEGETPMEAHGEEIGHTHGDSDSHADDGHTD